MRRFSLTAWAVLFIFLWAQGIAAQDNLLTNGGLEEGTFGPYQGKGRPDLNAPAGWSIWLGQGSTDTFMNRGDKVFGFPHRAPGPDPVEGQIAANLSGGFVQFNAALFQTVNVSPGANFRAEAASQVKACSPPGGGEGFCGSDLSSGAKTRIGIDPDGGTDPNAPEIVWSAWLEPHDRWDRQAVEATSTGGQITVFLYATQNQPYSNNNVWWDDVKLTGGGGGGSAPAAPNAAPPPTATPAFVFVPFVNAQGERPDGSIIHTVQQGDTLDSIAVAYGLTRQDLIDRNPSLQSIRFLNIGQQITIRPPQPTPVPTVASSSSGGIASTPVPGGVAPDEEEAAPLPSTPTPEGDVVLNNDPKGINTPTPALSEADSAAVADSVSALLGNLRGNAVPRGTAVADAGSAPEEEAPTEEETAAPEEEAPTEEPTLAPTATIQPTPTVPAVPTVDVAASTVSMCVSMFEDVNRNRLREANESLLAGGTIEILQNGTSVDSYTTDGTNEPHCFSGLEMGEYNALATAPQGYGLTTPAQLRLALTAGVALNIEFGALEGLVVADAAPPAEAPASETLGDSAEEVLPATGAASITDTLIAMSGVIVAVLAGVVILAGVGAAILLRRGR